MKPRFAPVRSSLTILFLMGLSVPVAAMAQERIETPYDWIDKSARVGIFGGHVSTGPGESNIGPRPSSIVGARLRARVSSPLSIELGVALGGSDRFVVDPRLDTGPAVVDTVDLNWIMFEAGFQIALTGARTLRKLQPYVLLTGGLLQGINETVSDSLAGADEEPFRYNVGSAAVFSGGVGVEWLPGGRFGLGVELRDHLWRIKTPDGFFQFDILQKIDELGLPAPRETEWTHNLELSASLYYYF